MPQPLETVSCGCYEFLLITWIKRNLQKMVRWLSSILFLFCFYVSLACVCNNMAKYRVTCASRRLFFQAVAALLRFVRENRRNEKWIYHFWALTFVTENVKTSVVIWRASRKKVTGVSLSLRVFSLENSPISPQKGKRCPVEVHLPLLSFGNVVLFILVFFFRFTLTPWPLSVSKVRQNIIYVVSPFLKILKRI